jgi:hypothetical protein
MTNGCTNITCNLSTFTTKDGVCHGVTGRLREVPSSTAAHHKTVDRGAHWQLTVLKAPSRLTGSPRRNPFRQTVVPPEGRSDNQRVGLGLSTTDQLNSRTVRDFGHSHSSSEGLCYSLQSSGAIMQHVSNFQAINGIKSTSV